MKKLFLAVISCMLFSAMQAQVVKIIKDNVVVASFPASAFDQVVFEPAAEAGISGEYAAQLNVTLVEMPQMGVLVSEVTAFTVSDVDDNHISLVLPQCVYAAMNETLPAITLENIEVSKVDGAYTFNQTCAGTDASGKNYSATVTGTLCSADDFEIVESMKYGSMPFTLKMVYTPVNAQ